jgi:hypothetical protein
MNLPKEEKHLLIEIQCFGNILFWAFYQKSAGLLFEAYEQFQKSGYRNRYFVLGGQGPLLLSVPVVGGRETKGLTTSVQIDNTKKWQDNHWKTLTSCYNKSPFFYHYADELRETIFQPHDLLWELNLSLFAWAKKQLRIAVPFHFTKSFQTKQDFESILDLRGAMKTGNRGQVLFNPYQQVFGTNFQQNLSILDLIFNLGPDSSSYLLNFNTI